MLVRYQILATVANTGISLEEEKKRKTKHKNISQSDRES